MKLTNTNTTENRLQYLSAFYDKYAGALYGTILRIVGKEIVAEKVLEKVFKNNINNQPENPSKQLSEFTCILNHSRKKSNESVKAIQIFEACNNGWHCVPERDDNKSSK
jgi:hypothetical protein